MAKTIKEQADSYVEMFKPFAHGHTSDVEELSAIHCAIIHVEGLMKELHHVGSLSIERLHELRDIITELKSRI